jgi:hypothetical protein
VREEIERYNPAASGTSYVGVPSSFLHVRGDVTQSLRENYLSRRITRDLALCLLRHIVGCKWLKYKSVTILVLMALSVIIMIFWDMIQFSKLPAVISPEGRMTEISITSQRAVY